MPGPMHKLFTNHQQSCLRIPKSLAKKAQKRRVSSLGSSLIWVVFYLSLFLEFIRKWLHVFLEMAVFERCYHKLGHKLLEVFPILAVTVLENFRSR
jgi:hypothetical protein